MNKKVVANHKWTEIKKISGKKKKQKYFCKLLIHSELYLLQNWIFSQFKKKRVVSNIIFDIQSKFE